jgi:tetratricopeptide (TPR) repeat protein
MSKLEKQKERARSLETKDPRGAIEAWLEALKAQEDEGEPNPDLSIFNRIGDLYLKVKDPAQAADYYDRAVDRYAELGFHNNAIAMCNKVLRNAPGRQTTYLKLAKLYAAKGFMAEAKQNFLDYAERMQKVGKIQQAFAALKEFADISAESAHLRELLEEHLRMYGAPEHRPAGAAAAPAPPKAEPRDDPTKSGKRKTSSLVFLDVDEPPASKGGYSARTAPPKPAAPPPPPPRPEPEPALEPEPVEGLIEPVVAEPDTSLEIESTSLVEGLEPTVPLEPTMPPATLEGFETTVAEFGDVRVDPADVPSVREELSIGDVAPMAELEPTVSEDAGAAEVEEQLEPLLDVEVEQPEPTVPRATSRVAPVSPKRPGGPPPSPAPGPRPAVGPPPRVPGPKAPAPKFEPPAAAPAKVKPVVPKRPAAAPPARKPVVEVPPLELEPDFDTTAAEEAQALDEQPLAADESPAGDAPPTITPSGRRSAAIDLGLDGVVTPGADRGSLVFADIEATPAPATIEELEARVADDPDDPEAHQALGEALIEAGERERGIEELDHATTGFENRGRLPHAQDLVDEILRLDPNSVRHRQKQVEFAFKSGDKVKLIAAYLELADTLLRGDLPDKARAVYQRVAEHDPGNERATAALAMLAPVAPPPPPPKAKAPARGAEQKTAARDAKMKVRDEAVDSGEFVDLSAMILDDELPERDTRMKVADEEPTGDEEQDFQDMLQRFKQGIDENIDEADFQAHYDLGVAFKEMGLLDEAIAELQKALRASEGKLRSSEALGVCFVEKGAYVVAESILRRALDLPASGDQERLGILYWLGRALEEQGKRAEARDLYGRVFAVDIRFKDVGARTKALAKAK